MLQEHHYARPPNYFIGLHRSQRGLMTSDLGEGNRKPTNRPPNIAAFVLPIPLALPLPCPGPLRWICRVDPKSNL